MTREWPDLYVLRHGETEWNAERRIQGQTESVLTERGKAQAARQGAILAGLGIEALPVHASPLKRVRQTVEIALPGRAVIFDDRLKELSLGRWEGFTRDEIGARYPDAFAETDPFLWFQTAPGGERYSDLAERVASFLADLDGPAVIASHGLAARFLRGHVLGLDLGGISTLSVRQGVVWKLAGGVETELA